MSVIDIGLNQTPKDTLAMKESVERTDPLKGEFSPSSLSYANCFRKYYFEKLAKLKPTYPAIPLLFGIAYHKGVETFYQNINSKDKTFEEVRLMAVQEFITTWSEYRVHGDAKRNLDVGTILMSRYCQEYRHENIEFTASDIEGSQWLKMPNGTMLLCKLDRMVDQEGATFVIDTKTTSMYLSDWFFKQFENHISTSLYYYVTEQLLGRCDYILIDAVHTPLLSANSTSTQFARRSFLRTDEQIEEALTSYCKKTDYLMEGLTLKGKDRLQHFYCNQDRCSDYGGCPYLDICKNTIDHPVVGTSFAFATPETEDLCRSDFSTLYS